MRHHIEERIYHVEILPPKQDTEKLHADLDAFAERFNRVMESGWCACLTDNAMGNLAFQGMETIEELGLLPREDLVMIHLNTFHTKEALDGILRSCRELGVRNLLVISGDGSDRLPRLQPADIGAGDTEAVTSVELLRYIVREHPGAFNLGVAFNPYEPEEHEFAKMERKLDSGAAFVVTQPVLGLHPLVERLMTRWPELPVVVEAWMSKRLDLLSEAVGYEIPEGTPYDPVENLRSLHALYPRCGVYLSLVGWKTQYGLLKDCWPRRSAP